MHHICTIFGPYLDHRWHTTNGLRSVHPYLTRTWCHHMDKGVARQMCTCGHITPPVCAFAPRFYGAPQWDTCSRGGHIAVMCTNVHHSVHFQHIVHFGPQMAYHKWTTSAPQWDTCTPPGPHMDWFIDIVHVYAPHMDCGLCTHTWHVLGVTTWTRVWHVKCAHVVTLHHQCVHIYTTYGLIYIQPSVGHVLAWWSHCCNVHLCTSFGTLSAHTPHMDHRWHTTICTICTICTKDHICTMCTTYGLIYRHSARICTIYAPKVHILHISPRVPPCQTRFGPISVHIHRATPMTGVHICTFCDRIHHIWTHIWTPFGTQSAYGHRYRTLVHMHTWCIYHLWTVLYTSCTLICTHMHSWVWHDEYAP